MAIYSYVPLEWAMNRQNYSTNNSKKYYMVDTRGYFTWNYALQHPIDINILR